MSLVKAAKKQIAGQNLKSSDVTPRVDTLADFDRINSILDNQIVELNGLDGILTELNKEKLSLVTLLELLVKVHDRLSN